MSASMPPNSGGVPACRIPVGAVALIALGAIGCRQDREQAVAMERTAPAVPALQAAPVEDSARTWNFDAMMPGQPPEGFLMGRTGSAVGSWIVRSVDDAPSERNVLVQMNTDATSDRFPVAVADAPSLRDLTLAVRCKPVAGRVDQACGIVFRYQDENNYYVTRANALEDDVRLYHVTNGRRREIASWSGRVTREEWHELRADARGDRLAVYWDGQRVIEEQDRTLQDAGKVGVWLKADSFTEFDDLSVAPLRE